MKLKLVLDTNIIVSALTYGGKPQIIYEYIVLKKVIQCYTSEKALIELLRVLKNKFDYSSPELKLVENKLRNKFVFVQTKKSPDIITEDPSDNEFLTIAEKTGADYIISGDRHLLNLKQYKKIPIITATKFLEDVIH